MIFLTAWACVAAIDVCPDEDRRFEPDLDPAQTGDDYLDNCEGQGAGFSRGDVVFVCCTSEWCASGFEGEYCVNEDRLRRWLADDCPFCAADDRQPLIGGGDFTYSGPYDLDVSCSPRSKAERGAVGC